MNNEPVAFRWKSDLGYIYDVFNHGNGESLYTHPVKELTDEEINKIADMFGINKYSLKMATLAILRKAQEK